MTTGDISFILVISFISILFIFGLIMLTMCLFDSGNNDLSLIIISIFMVLLPGSSICIIIYNAIDYEETIEKIYPNDTTIIFDNEEVLIEFDEKKYIINGYKNATRILNKSFYIKKNIKYNFLNYPIETCYKICTQNTHNKMNAPIPIEL